MKESNTLVTRWVLKADHDLGTAKLTYLHLPEYSDTISFHCQQAVEKYIKALLIFYDIEFMRSHNLVYLLSILADKIIIDNTLYENAIKLNSFSVEIRYPNEILELTKGELELSIKTAEDFQKLVEEITYS